MTETVHRLRSALSAARWLGTKEGSAGHRTLIERYNAIHPLPVGYVMQERDPWCAAFVSAAAQMAGLGERYPLECGCDRMIEKAKQMGIWQEADSFLPGIGDWVLYNWQAKSDGDDTGSADHVGIVIGVEDGVILVVEGNYDNAVKLRRLKADDRSIRGFVCPRFDDGEKEKAMCYHTLEQVPAYARGIVEKLVRDGSLLGVAEDDLGLSEDLLRMLVILDRRGLM